MNRDEYAATEPPLDAPIESVDKHDPTTTRSFMAIFSHPENADIVRALTVGLAINDPERPEPEEPETPRGGTDVLDDDEDECDCPDEHVALFYKALMEGRVTVHPLTGRVTVAPEVEK